MHCPFLFSQACCFWIRLKGLTEVRNTSVVRFQPSRASFDQLFFSSSFLCYFTKTKITQPLLVQFKLVGDWPTLEMHITPVVGDDAKAPGKYDCISEIIAQLNDLIKIETEYRTILLLSSIRSSFKPSRMDSGTRLILDSCWIWLVLTVQSSALCSTICINKLHIFVLSWCAHERVWNAC